MHAPKVAVLQDQFRLSGRTKVACETIHLLNELGIVPDVLTFTPAAEGQYIGRFFDLKDLRLNYVRVAPVPCKRGNLWQTALIHHLTRARQARYAMIFNSNNTLDGLNAAGCFLNYICYPFAGPDAGSSCVEPKSCLRRLYTRASAQLLALGGRASPEDGVYTISEFSRQAILRAYPDSRGKIDIIHPPSFEDTTVCRGKRELRCVTIGSILRDKRQMDQLVIASQLPEIEFWIVGNVRSSSYYRACQDYVQRAGLSNVRFKVDLPYKELQHLLRHSMFFLHTKRDEPFGMSTVEAIAAGCVPVTHDSGGQREVVPFSQLRFASTDGAVRTLRDLMGTSLGQVVEMRQALQEHIQQFSRGAFRERMREALRKKLAA